MFNAVTNKTVFSKNVNSFNTVITNADAQNKITLDLYNKLSIYIKTIRTLLDEYAKGNFYIVANILTDTIYKKMSLELFGLAANPQKFANYENIRLANTSALSGLYQSILQHSKLVDTEVKLEKALEYEKILNDPIRLKEYIKMLQGRSRIFPEKNVQVMKATIKPEYGQYIKMFGFPEGGVFEMDKLAMALNSLNMNA